MAAKFNLDWMKLILETGSARFWPMVPTPISRLAADFWSTKYPEAGVGKITSISAASGLLPATRALALFRARQTLANTSAPLAPPITSGIGGSRVGYLQIDARLQDTYYLQPTNVATLAAAQQEILFLTNHDTLTGLPNRSSLLHALGDLMSKRDHASSVALLFLDIDEFAAINERLGYAAGDELIAQFARRTTNALTEAGLRLFYWGGSQFVVLQLADDHCKEAATSLALKIADTVSPAFDLRAGQLCVGISVGVALARAQSFHGETVLKEATAALRAAKRGGGNKFKFYSRDLEHADAGRHEFENELREAIVKEQFEVFYQPIFDTKTRVLRGAEALVRWRHPQQGLIAPDAFIPTAEATGLIVPLGNWVLQRACRDAASWPSQLRVAINISATQFNTGQMFDVILCALAESGLEPARLEIEITESALLDRRSAHLHTMQKLKQLGVWIALDDFGTGYSSASYLAEFPFDRIKIDKTFTQGVADRRDCVAIVASILALARGLDLEVTAEGIETEYQLEFMRNSGVGFGQGYLFGKPVPLSAFEHEHLKCLSDGWDHAT